MIQVIRIQPQLNNDLLQNPFVTYVFLDLSKLFLQDSDITTRKSFSF